MNKLLKELKRLVIPTISLIGYAVVLLCALAGFSYIVIALAKATM